MALLNHDVIQFLRETGIDVESERQLLDFRIYVIVSRLNVDRLVFGTVVLFRTSVSDICLVLWQSIFWLPLLPAHSLPLLLQSIARH